ncbi:hypothetical protein AAHC03_0882 [Spirometra sp. Aus1]
MAQRKSDLASSGQNCSTTNSNFGRIIASSFGGMITSLVMTPLDVVKIRMQAASRISSCEKCFLYCNGLMDHLCASVNSASNAHTASPWYSHPTTSKTAWVGLSTCHNASGIDFCVLHSGLRSFPTEVVDGFRTRLSSIEALSKIVKSEGILSLWSGLSPTLAMALPQTVVYYSVNDWLKEKLGYTKSASKSTLHYGCFSSNDFVPALVGALSRTIAVFTISPLELLRTKLQSQKMSLKNVYDVLQSTVVSSGFRSLWMGMGPTLLRDVPYSAIFWFVYDYNKYKYLPTVIEITPHSEGITRPIPGFSSAFLFGACAGFTAGLITHPFDVVKTHRQIELGESIFGNRAYSKSTLLALRQLYRQKGLQALYSGFTPRLLKTTTASALMVSLFELLRQNLVA